MITSYSFRFFFSTNFKVILLYRFCNFKEEPLKYFKIFDFSKWARDRLELASLGIEDLHKLIDVLPTHLPARREGYNNPGIFPLESFLSWKKSRRHETGFKSYFKVKLFHQSLVLVLYM